MLDHSGAEPPDADLAIDRVPVQTEKGEATVSEAVEVVNALAHRFFAVQANGRKGKVELGVDGEDRELADLMPLVFINPELELGEVKEKDTEGCLSIRDVRADVNRPASLRARLPQLDGSVLELETDGLLARAIQHETDHLNGVLFIDRVSPATKLSLKRKLRRLAAEG